jgi:hypothetical protein
MAAHFFSKKVRVTSFPLRKHVGYPKIPCRSVIAFLREDKARKLRGNLGAYGLKDREETTLKKK